MSKLDLSKGIKIILLGESGVGKTNLIRVATGEEFEQNTMSSSSGSYKEGFYISSTKKKIYLSFMGYSGTRSISFIK